MIIYSLPALVEPTSVQAQFTPVPTNRVAGSGRAQVTLCGNRATVDVTVSGVPRRVPQAMHVRVNGRGARPAASSATQLNGRTALSTTDGHPASGMIGK